MDAEICEILGPEADDLLNHQCRTIARDMLYLPGPAFIDEVISLTDRRRGSCGTCSRYSTTADWRGQATSRSCPWTRASSIRPVAFAPNPIYFDPENIVKLAIEGQCNAVASTLGVLGAVSRKYAHKSRSSSRSTTTSCSATRIPTTSVCSAPWNRPLTWARWRWGRPSITARRNPGGRSRRSPPPSSRP